MLTKRQANSLVKRLKRCVNEDDYGKVYEIVLDWFGDEDKIPPSPVVEAFYETWGDGTYEEVYDATQLLIAYLSSTTSRFRRRRTTPTFIDDDIAE
jgi:hypothetical protein